MPEQYHVRVANDSLVFSAAHFIIFDNGICEPLHGHDYHVAVELAGPLGEASYVVDFLVVQAALREILSTLDHRVLLPSQHPLLSVSNTPQEALVRLENHSQACRWVFPRSHCQVLDIPNTTSETLARWIGQQLLEKLSCHLYCISIELRDGCGQSAIWQFSYQ